MTTAPTKEFFYEHFIKPQQWTTTADQVDYRLVRDGDTLLIVFQQSQGPECWNGFIDWLRNFMCKPRWYQGGKCFIHNGFLTGWARTAGVTLKIREEIINGATKLLFIGYSQGCPLSMLECAHLRKLKSGGLGFLQDVEILPPICFAPPATVWCLFSWRMRKYIKDVRLVMTRKDIVPKVLQWLGYVLIGIKEYYDEPAGYVHPANIAKWMQGTGHYPGYYMACLPSEKEVKA